MTKTEKVIAMIVIVLLVVLMVGIASDMSSLASENMQGIRDIRETHLQESEVGIDLPRWAGMWIYLAIVGCIAAIAVIIIKRMEKK